MKLFICSLLPALAFRFISLRPLQQRLSVKASVLQPIRPEIFRLSGAGAISATRGTTTTYTAPAALAAPPPTLDGCMAAPGDSVIPAIRSSIPGWTACP